MKLNGINVPEGEGIVLEVHLDLQHTTSAFTAMLNGLGFENDPFATFFPTGYVAHMTGRLRVLQKDLRNLLPRVNSLVAGIIKKAMIAECALYTEVELVREIYRFEPSDGILFNRALDVLKFSGSGKLGGAKSDVHVEFPYGKVPDEVRAYLSEKMFYWVSTPETPHCHAEEIATLQTSTYPAGKRVCDLLVANPLPGCTAIHLEQKLSMTATNFNLVMPEVIMVG
ncbi:MAG: hypothetical protein JWP09_563 [Candidatus Taylorbacteria bacterium]|nr:hypothetical protein [Candidatus Taylorbacteria bacterium]